MKIGTIDLLESNSNSEDLLNYLSQILLTITDNEIKKENKKLLQERKKIKAAKELMKEKKQIVEKNQLVLAKEKQLENVLKMIELLLDSGSLIGQNQTKVSRILEEIEEKDYDSLRTLEQKLSLLRSES
jgi:hypothetical protein